MNTTVYEATATEGSNEVSVTVHLDYFDSLLGHLRSKGIEPREIHEAISKTIHAHLGPKAGLYTVTTNTKRMLVPVVSLEAFAEAVQDWPVY